MSAADRLRALIAGAPPLSVEVDHHQVTLWDDSDLDRPHPMFVAHWASAEAKAALRLIGPLLAAAPHLADLLDDLDTNTDPTAAARRVRDAIKEATP